MSVNVALLTDEANLPFSPTGKRGQSGYCMPQVFLFQENDEWRVDLLRSEKPNYKVTLSFHWRLERTDGQWQMHVTPQRISIVSDGAPVERLPTEAVDVLIVFLVEHWPGAAAPDVLRVLLQQPEWQVLQRCTLGWRVELTQEQKAVLIEMAKKLKGYERRIFMARMVEALGKGGQRRAEQELGWSRCTIRKGMNELKDGQSPDNYSARGRKRAEDFLPDLMCDIKDILGGRSYPWIPTSWIREQLVARKGYCRADLPCDQTLRNKRRTLEGSDF